MSGESVTIVTDTNTPSVTDPAKPARPESVPEKFWDSEKGVVRVDDLVKSYGELEKKVGAPKPAGEAPLKVEPAAATDDKKVANDLAAKGVDYARLQAELTKDGKLGDETYADLEKRGIPRAMVDDFIAARTEQASAARSYALDGIGEETFGQVVEWAKSNLPQADIDAFNRLVDGAKSKDDLRAAVSNLHARYEQANGHEPSLSNAPRNQPAGNVYRDIAEMQADMNDPRYHKSEAFREQVQAKLARSSIM
jgi:hypothetical protein